jgi:hypothetical protein
VFGSNSLLVWAGFAGEETNDGAIFDIMTKTWHKFQQPEGEKLRPRSVCVAGTLHDGSVVVFGGEVNPSDRGHEGAGGFCEDVLLIQPKPDRSVKFVQDCNPVSSSTSPGPCGWAGGDAAGNSLFVFGGLTGDDTNPKRLGGLWKLTLSPSSHSQAATTASSSSSSVMNNALLGMLCLVSFGAQYSADAFSIPSSPLMKYPSHELQRLPHLSSFHNLSQLTSCSLAQLREGYTSSAVLQALPGWAEVLLADGAVPMVPALVVNVALFAALSSQLFRMLTPAGFTNALLLGTGLWTTLGWKGWLYCVLYLFLGQVVTKIRFAEKEVSIFTSSFCGFLLLFEIYLLTQNLFDFS